MNNLISVIMSVKNGEIFLDKSIQSILNQSYKNLEFLILDDCSTDESYEIIKNYGKKDKRIKFFRNDKNLGLTASLNILISKSKGSIIARQDADDISVSDRLEKQLKKLNDSDSDFVVSRAKSLQNNSYIPRFSYYLPDKFIMKYKNPFIHGTLLIKKSVLISENGYDEKFYYAQDYELFKRLLQKNIKYKYIGKALYILNTVDNISTKRTKEQNYFFELAKNTLKNQI